MQKSQRTKIYIFGGVFVAIVFLVAITYDFIEDTQMQDTSIPLVSLETREITLEDYIEQKESYYVIDIREIEEFDQGHFSDAIHLPLGELLASKEKQVELRDLSATKKLVFFCHDGLRSQIAADTVGGNPANVLIFHKGHKQVRNKELTEEIWTGSRKRVLPEDFHNALKAREYDLSEIPSGALIADVTWDQVYKSGHPDVITAPLMRLTQNEIEGIVSEIAPRSFIAVCNSRMSCFYAKVLGYRIEKFGGYFSGYFRIGK